MNNHIFKLEPEPFSTKLSIRHFYTSNKKIEVRCKIIQISANTYDASTGHKLQGTKDAIIVTS